MIKQWTKTQFQTLQLAQALAENVAAMTGKEDHAILDRSIYSCMWAIDNYDEFLISSRRQAMALSLKKSARLDLRFVFVLVDMVKMGFNDKVLDCVLDQLYADNPHFESMVHGV